MVRLARLGCPACLLIALSTTTAAAQTTTVVVPGPPGTSGVTTVTFSQGARDSNTPQTGTSRIRGRVVDAETGAALHDTLLRLGGGGLREGPTAGTDDNGRFEFENLPAGRYTLTATKPGFMTLSYGQRRPFENGRQIDLVAGQTLEGVDFAVPRGGVIVVRVVDETGDPVSGVRVVAMRYRFAGQQRTLTQVNSSFDGTDDRGELRLFGLPPGEYYVGTATFNPTMGAAANGTSYIATYYPGTASTDTAQRVTVEIGKEVQANFPLVAAKLARVAGIVRRADGSAAARSSVTLIGMGPNGSFGRGAAVQPDGTFTITDVPPGEYSLRATFPGAGPAERELGSAILSVSGKDLAGVTVTTGRGGAIRGRVTFEPQAPANLRLTSIRPYLMPVITASNMNSVMLSTSPSTQDDGAFTIDGVFEQGLVRVLTLPAGWYLKEVRLGGKDVTDVPIGGDVGSDLAGVEVVLTQKRAEINGSAADARGTAASDYAVVVFPEDRTQWTAESRFIMSARPDQRGRFSANGLPPGKYLAAAVDYLEQGSERDPELLNRLRDRATAVTVDDGESKTVTLLVQ